MSIGTDIIEIKRIKKAVETSPRFLSKYFTQVEIALFDTRQGKSKYPTIAANFAGKEAVAKALGTGLGAVKLIEIEVLRSEQGAPVVSLHGQALTVYEQLMLAKHPVGYMPRSTEEGIHISLSHSKAYAVAMVVIAG